MNLSLICVANELLFVSVANELLFVRIVKLFLSLFYCSSIYVYSSIVWRFVHLPTWRFVHTLCTFVQMNLFTWRFVLLAAI